MSYYTTCRLCGANLDPGERCDCIRKALTAEQSNRAYPSQRVATQEGNPSIPRGTPSIQEGGSTYVN